MARTSDFSRAIAVLRGDVGFFSDSQLRRPRETLEDYYDQHPRPPVSGHRFDSFPESRQDEAENVLDTERERRIADAKDQARELARFDELAAHELLFEELTTRGYSDEEAERITDETLEEP